MKTCTTCRYSRWKVGGPHTLHCEHPDHPRPCGAACDDYERDPGSDDEITESREAQTDD